jgi:hypothetical protein
MGQDERPAAAQEARAAPARARKTRRPTLMRHDARKRHATGAAQPMPSQIVARDSGWKR